jgi:hypothetical protein
MQAKTHSKAWYLLLLIPIVAVLWVPWYNAVEPRFLGFPFFYWYQLMWVPLSAVVIAIVYRMTKP